MMNENVFHKIIEELCIELNIKLEKLCDGDWVLQLTKNNVVRHIIGYRFDLNSEASGDIACDKSATYQVLKSQHIPAVEHNIIFNPATRGRYIPNGGVWDFVINEFNKCNMLVVKPNSGSEGYGVSLCKTMKETENAISRLFKTEDSVCICPYYDIEREYRTFYLDGEILLIYGKIKPYVIGDGISTISELIKGLDIPQTAVANDNIKALDLAYVPAKDEQVFISWKHNLSGGANPEVLERGELYNKIEELALKTGKAMNVKFASIDIVKMSDGDLRVLEVNSGIGTSIFAQKAENGYEIIKEIYRKALNKMFEE